MCLSVCLSGATVDPYVRMEVSLGAGERAAALLVDSGQLNSGGGGGGVQYRGESSSEAQPAKALAHFYIYICTIRYS